jgi:alpha-methylacyl-CoA racemase
VMERLGLGPEVFLGTGNSPGLNDKLVYARMIGSVPDHFTLRR